MSGQVSSQVSLSSRSVVLRLRLAPRARARARAVRIRAPTALAPNPTPSCRQIGPGHARANPSHALSWYLTLALALHEHLRSYPAQLGQSCFGSTPSALFFGGARPANIPVRGGRKSLSLFNRSSSNGDPRSSIPTNEHSRSVHSEIARMLGPSLVRFCLELREAKWAGIRHRLLVHAMFEKVACLNHVPINNQLRVFGR